MQTRQPSLFARDDTFFGVCEAIGQDFGFNPNWLRVTLGALLLFAPVAVIVSYFTAGLAVLAARRVFPVPASAAAATPLATVTGANDDAPRCLAA